MIKNVFKMKKMALKKSISTIPLLSILFSTCFSDDIFTGLDNSYFRNSGVMSMIDAPWKNWYYDFEWWSDLLIIVKEILARAVEYLPMLVLIVLLLACVKIIFDWDGKAWLKRIKYVLIWVWLMILAVYLVNILSTIFFWHPVLNINFHRWY